MKVLKNLVLPIIMIGSLATAASLNTPMPLAAGGIISIGYMAFALRRNRCTKCGIKLYPDNTGFCTPEDGYYLCKSCTYTGY